MAPGEGAGAERVVAVLVRQQDGAQVGRGQPGAAQGALDRPLRKTAVHQQCATVGFDQRRIAAAAGSQRSHAHHGSEFKMENGTCKG
jgi:hypothetical protein